MKKLDKLYEEYGYPSAGVLYKIAKGEGIEGLTQAEVRRFVESQDVNQIHSKRRRKTMKESAIVAPNSNMYYQADLLDMSGYKGNNNHNWILLLVDIFDRRCVAKALKTKSSKSVSPAFIDAIEELGTPYPQVITTDQGNEFKAGIDKWMTERGILHLASRVGDHSQLGIVDRLSKTIKEKIYKEFTRSGNERWNSKLQKIIEAYNNTPHSGLFDMTPNEAFKHPEITTHSHLLRLEKAKKRKQPVLNVGDKVRVKLERGRLSKGYLPQFSKQVHTIVGKQGGYFELSNGEIVRRYMLRKI